MRVWVGVAGVSAVGIALGVWWLDRGAQPAPSLPRDLVEYHPAVQLAIREAHALVAQHPGDAAAWFSLGLVYHGNELWSDAAEAYERSATLLSDDPRVWYCLGQARRELNQLNDAIDAMTHAAEHAPGFAPAHWRLGMLLLESERLDEAAAAFERSIRIDPSDAAGAIGLARVNMMRGQHEIAIAQLQQVLVSMSTPHYADYVRHLLATAHRRLGQRESRSSDHGAHLGHATLASQMTGAMPPGSHPHSAISLTDPWQLEIRRYACSPSARLEFAMELGSARRLDEAVALLQDLKKEANYNVALVESNLSMLYRAQGRLDESIRAAEASLALNGQFCPAHFNLAMSQAAKAESTLPREASALRESAMAHLGTALAINPTYAPAHGLRGQLLSQAGDVESALKAFESASQCARESPLWPLERAKLLVTNGRPREAISLLLPLTATAPEYADVYLCLADAFEALGERDACRTALEQGARLRPRDANIQRRLQEISDSMSTHGPALR